MRAYDGGRKTRQGHVLSARTLRCCKKFRLIQNQYVEIHGGYHHFSYFSFFQITQACSRTATTPGHGAKE